MQTMLRSALIDYAFGLRDACCGLTKLHVIDSDEDLHNKPYLDQNPSPSTPMNILKKRRLEEQQKENIVKVSSGPIDVKKKTKAWVRILHCIVVNVVCLCSVYILQELIKSLTFDTTIGNYENSWLNWLRHGIVILFTALWLLPMFIISRLVNIIWFQDIANATLRRQRHKQKQTISFSKTIADFILAILVESIFLLQIYLIDSLPVPFFAALSSFVHMSLLYALYSFEYFWTSRGHDLNWRLSRMHNYWVYYCGFGTPMTLLTTVVPRWIAPHSTYLQPIISASIFGAAFPFFLISAYYTSKIPSQTLSPANKLPSLKLFLPCIYICNAISNSLYRKCQSLI